MTLCCVRGVWLPQLPGGYLWLLCVTSIIMTLCCVSCVLLPQLLGGYLWLPLVIGVTWYWLYTWSTGQHCYHSYLCLASAITIIVQLIHSIVALPELTLLLVTWACNSASPHILPLLRNSNDFPSMCVEVDVRPHTAVCRECVYNYNTDRTG